MTIDTATAEELVARYQGGESLDDLAHNFGLPTEDDVLDVLDWASRMARDWAPLARSLPGWPADEQGALEAFYGPHDLVKGRPSAAWEATHLTRFTPPWRMLTAWEPQRPVFTFRCHRKVAASLHRVLGHIWDNYGNSQEAIEAARLHLFGGCYEYRASRGGSRLSLHSWGAAIDLDPTNNALGKAWDSAHGIPWPVVEAFDSEGWVWGGRWATRPDPMHFQATG